MHLTVFIILLALPLLAAAQPVIRVTTRLVDVSVIARDAKGSVANLTQNEFTVFDNGVERPVAFFSMNSTRLPVSPVTPRPANVFTNRASREDAPVRLTVFVLDALNSAFESQVRMRQQLLRYIPKVTPRDRVAVWLMTDRLRRVQDFTNDTDQLAKSVSHIMPSLLLMPEKAAGASMRNPTNGGEQFASAASAATAEMEQYYRLQVTNDLMKDLGTALARIPGRKNVIWLSDAFPINMSIGPGGPETAYVTARLTGTGRALAKADAALYPVDTQGLTAPAGGQSVANVAVSERNRHATLDVLAATTGGRAFYDTNDIATAIGEAAGDTEVTYTLGFYPGGGAEDGNFHRLQIEVKRPGVTLRYRPGYVASDAQVATSQLTGREEIGDALISPVDVLGIGFSARLEARDPKRPGWLPMTIAFPSSEIMLDEADGKLGSVEIIVSQHAADGRALVTVGDVVRVDPRRPRGETLLKEGLLVRRQVQLANGASKIRVVVFDRNSGRIGSIEFPAPAR